MRSFLLGAQDNVTALGASERVKISQASNVSVDNTPEAAFVSKKCFMADRELGGTVFSLGDAVIVRVNGQEVVAKLDCFLSVRLTNELSTLKLLVKLFFYSTIIGDDELPVRDFWSGFIKVHSREIPDPAFLQVNDILRKVILYKSEDDILTVADFQRHSQSLPYSVIVPVYPENGDMLLIQGEGIKDIWYGHVHSTDYSRKTVDVFFFCGNLSNRSENVFVREAHGRYARNVVPWESILGIAEGQWESSSCWQKKN